MGVALFVSAYASITLASANEPALSKIGPALHHPWGMDFLRDNELLVTERRGNLLQIKLVSIVIIR